jgi:predicted DCC family thiol-disulfide oxidoreductase YuxK
MQTPAAIIFFDGYCHLCCRSVKFILRRDPRGYFTYAPIDGATADQLLKKSSTSPLPDSIVLYENGKIYTRSTAALRVARKLCGAWPLLYIFMLIPPPIRNAVYNIIARNRYKWFGRSESCWMPKSHSAIMALTVSITCSALGLLK